MPNAAMAHCCPRRKGALSGRCSTRAIARNWYDQMQPHCPIYDGQACENWLFKTLTTRHIQRPSHTISCICLALYYNCCIELFAPLIRSQRMLQSSVEQ